MKIFAMLSLLVSSLIAAAYFFVDAVDPSNKLQTSQPLQVFDYRKSFQNSTHYMNAITKRGDIDQIILFKSTVDTLEEALKKLHDKDVDTLSIIEDINRYEKTVLELSALIKNQTPLLQQKYQTSKTSLAFFNKKLNSIGLHELSTAWMELSKIKHDYMRSPNCYYEQAFNEKWMYITVLITELYLDDEMEAPLFDYLEVYKNYFDDIVLVYNEEGQERVAMLKVLSYDIKLKLEMLPL